MINRTRCLFYEVGGVFYKDLIEAQKADLLKILPPDLAVSELADWMLKNANDLAVILTTTPKSRRRKPRKDKGIPRKVRTPNVQPQPA